MTTILTKLIDVIKHPKLYQKEYSRFAKFALVGVSGAVVDFTLLNIGMSVFEWPLWLANTIWPLLLTNTVSVGAAILNNFTWNRLWTFPESQTRKKRTQIMQFATVNTIGLVLNNLIVLLINWLIDPIVGQPWSYNIAKAMAIGIVLFWNFGANRLWTYRGL